MNSTPVVGSLKGSKWNRVDVFCGAEILTPCWKYEAYEVHAVSPHSIIGHSLTKREAWELYKLQTVPVEVLFVWDAGDAEAGDGDRVVVWPLQAETL